ncbi:MAG: hypothetical protein FWH11_09040 [Micrococcales bacterium]|nr:hypothetical protein [Micrococcales bacterium]
MTDTTAASVGPAADLRQDLAPVLGRGVRVVQLEADGALLLELGGPRPVARGNRGPFLWVYAPWRVETDTEVLATCAEELAASVRVLDDQVLTGADVEVPSLSATFFFADGLRLRTFSVTDTDVQWELYLRGRWVRTAGPAWAWTLHRDTDETEPRR